MSLFLTLGAVKESLEINKEAVALNIILLLASRQRETCSYSASKDLAFDFVNFISRAIINLLKITF